MIPRKEIIEPVGKRQDVGQCCKQWMLRCGRLAMFPFAFMLSPFTRLLLMSILLTTILRSFSTLTFLFSGLPLTGLPLTSSVGLPGTLSP